ncbi:phage major capsid protein [Actinomadura litoris]|uniref:DUF2184 domain-containing protein n=1 Tax=Actinomadura litoris TaxID=2678616 RepID=A0A7K1LAG4_9ACTN|nr:DUF2184 domain-containing protein [Actinomadura litoris]MUN41412.1 DUF2184 domain-containing protein [Actinomadura litoris]
MPDAYPPGAPSLSGDLLTISRLLQSPAQITRRLRTFVDLRFISDQVLTQRFRTSGGAIAYEVSEPIVNTRPVESVAPGSEYPMDTPSPGTGALAAVEKWGQGTFLTDESIKRTVKGGDALDRALRKTVNTIITKVDGITMSAVGSAITATQAATGSGSNRWANATAAMILRDIELAKAQVVDLKQGYNPNIIVMSNTKYAYMASDPTIASLRRREATDNPVYNGRIEIIGDLIVVPAPLSSLPSDDVWIIDNEELGGMADEAEVDPGYAVSDMAIQVQSERKAKRDAWELWGRRLTVPVIQEPGAGIKITNT